MLYMAKTLTIVVGALFGVVGGIAAGMVLLDFGSDRTERFVGGAFVGALCGLVGGAIGSDLAGKTPKDETRSMLGITTGGITGAVSAAQCVLFLQAVRLLTMLFPGLR